MFLTQAVYINLAISTATIAISFPFTVLFNGLLIWNIIRRPMLRKKNFMVVIGYLAVTDLATGVFVQPTFIARQLCRITGQCRIYDVDTVFYYLVIVTCGSSISHLTLVACERYIAIKHALRYAVIATTNRLLTRTIMVWILEFALNAIFLYNFGPIIYDIVAAIALLFCISLIVYFYTAIYLESSRHRRQIRVTAPQNETSSSRKKEFKAAKTTALVLGFLLTCYAPSVIVMINIHFISPVNSYNGSLWSCAIAWQSTFVLLNSLFNPLIYGCRVQEIKQLVASSFNWRRTNTDVIEMVEVNRKRINLGDKKTCEEPAIEISTKATELTAKICFDSNAETDEKHEDSSRPQVPPHISPRDDSERANPNTIGNDADSENNFQLNQSLSEGKNIEREQNEMTLTAMVHFNHV